MQFRIKQSEKNLKVECKKEEGDQYYICAVIDEDSRLVFYGDFSNQMCNEIENFLENECIHIDENGIAYQLIN